MAQKKEFASSLVPVFSSGFIIPGCRVLRFTVGCNSFVIVACYWLSGVKMLLADCRLSGVAVGVGVGSKSPTVGLRVLVVDCLCPRAQFFHLSLPTSASYAGIVFLANWLTQVLTSVLLVLGSHDNRKKDSLCQLHDLFFLQLIANSIQEDNLDSRCTSLRLCI
jgi:hypothetical protein